MAALPHFALYAIRYGSVRRKQSELFWGGDPARRAGRA